MYASNVKGERLNFAVSGMLWKRSLVMRDEETGSLWSHILGKCMQGKLEGHQLEVIPSLLTSWGDWRKLHPKTTAVVLSRTSKAFNQKFYSQPDKFLVGISVGNQARAWRFSHLLEKKVINDQWRAKPVVVSLSTPSYSATIFSRTTGTRTLTFVADKETIRDKETGSVWDLQLGKCRSGKLAGTQLNQLRGIPSFARAWESFHPKSTYWEPAAKAD